MRLGFLRVFVSQGLQLKARTSPFQLSLPLYDDRDTVDQVIVGSVTAIMVMVMVMLCTC